MISPNICVLVLQQCLRALKPVCYEAGRLVCPSAKIANLLFVEMGEEAATDAQSVPVASNEFSCRFDAALAALAAEATKAEEFTGFPDVIFTRG